MVSFGSSRFIQSCMLLLGVCFMMMMSTVNAFPVADTNSLEKRGPDACLGFRVTSPQKSGLRFTYGQCYEVSWDLGASTVKTIKQIKLINSKTNKSHGTVASNIAASKLASGHFPLVMKATGATEGDFYYSVEAVTGDGKQTCTVKSTTFYIMVNPNSPPSTSCP